MKVQTFVLSPVIVQKCVKNCNFKKVILVSRMYIISAAKNREAKKRKETSKCNMYFQRKNPFYKTTEN